MTKKKKKNNKKQTYDSYDIFLQISSPLTFSQFAHHKLTWDLDLANKIIYLLKKHADLASHG